MPKYRVTIEGRTYEVDVEAVEGEPAGKAAPKAPAPSSKQPAAGTASGGVPEGRQIKAPLAGTILSVFVTKGESVKKGKVLLTLEALKLENEITAPQDGTVSYVVSEGTSVDIGQVLAVIN